MADNIAVTPGTGATVAADDIGGGVLVQRIKPTFGADGTATDVSGSNPLPIVQTGALPTGTNTIGTVNIAASQLAPLATTAQPMATGFQLVGLPTDQPAISVREVIARASKGVTQTTISASTTETTIVAAVASTFVDIYGLILANTGSTACAVTLKDATAGTTRAKIYVPAGDTRGFMADAGSAMQQAVVNNNWTATCSASTAAMEVTAMWVRNT